MTYVVTEDCIKCKYMDCVEVCPVDCFYEGDNMLVIHPDECIDCGVCEPECPPNAIIPDSDGKAEKWLKMNAEFAVKWPNITRKGTAPPLQTDAGLLARCSLHIFRRGCPYGVVTAAHYVGRLSEALSEMGRTARST